MADDDQEVENWSPEEEQRLLTLLDDATKATIGTMFMGRESGGFIVMDQLTDIMTELQVAFDANMLAKVVSEEDWDRISNDRALLIIAYCIDAAQKQVAEQAKAESAVVVSQVAQPVVYLNTLQYLWHLTPCATKEEGVEYRWNKVTFDVRPKTILMVSVAVMMVLAAVALITAVIGLNELARRKQASDSLNHLGVTVEVTSSVVLEETVRSITADALRTTSGVLSATADSILSTQQDIIRTQLHVGLLQGLSAAEVAGQQAMQGMQDAADTRVQTLRTLFSTGGTKEALLVLLRGWVADGVRVLAVDTADTPLIQPANCNGHTVPSFAVVQTSMGMSGTAPACGETVAYSCVIINQFGMKVCTIEDTAVQTTKLEAAIDSLVTEMNLLRPSSTVELQAAVRATGDATYSGATSFSTLGGRKQLASLCVRNHECGRGEDVFHLAANSTSGTDIVTGYNSAAWLTSYGRIDVQGRQFFFGLKEDVQEGKDRFFDALGTGSSINRNSTTSPFVVFAVADSLERVELLPVNTTAATSTQDTYLGYALNGRHGISFPEPEDPASLMAGYSSSVAGDLAVGVEYTAPEISQEAVNFVVSSLEALNNDIPETWDVVVASRSTEDDAISYLLPFKVPCPSGGCRQHDGVEEAFLRKGEGEVEGLDHHGRHFKAWYKYYAQFPPVVVLVQYSKTDLDDSIVEHRWVSLGVGVGIIIAVQLIILLLTRRVLDRIESDYNKYKRQIEEEKLQFSDLVKDVMPPYIAERIMKGTRLIAETHPQLTFFFSDIVGSTESSKALTNKQLVRMLGYSFMLEDIIANFFGVHKIKTIGDAYFAVSGLEDNQSGGAGTGKDHQVYRMVSFACICQQLFGPAYDHFPERTDCFRVSAEGQQMDKMKMVRMRMGIHTGPAVAGVVDVGRAPHFDCFGPSVNLASRMESTSAPGRVQLSGPAQEVLAKVDKEGLFEFEAPRKTLVKGYGTMVTYLVKSTNLPVPEELIEEMQIDRATTRQFFSANERKAGAGGNSDRSSSHHASERGSEKGAPSPEQSGGSKSKKKEKSSASPKDSALPVPAAGGIPAGEEPIPSLLMDIVTPPLGMPGQPPASLGAGPPPPPGPAMTPPPSALPPADQQPLPTFSLAMPPPPPAPEY